MKIYGGIYFNEDGLSNSIRGMHLQTSILSSVNDNIQGFNKVGYQRKEPVVSSFAELIGSHALSSVVDDEVGRLRKSDNPFDFSLATKGYFQYATPYGIKLTRDGRFKLDKDGYMLTQENYKVLSAAGQPIKFNSIPESFKDVKVNTEGKITVLDRKLNKMVDIGQFSVVSKDGSSTNEVDVRQGYTEDSNISLSKEFFSLIPVRRNFEANRMMYITQNDELTKTIQELGRSS